MRRRHLTSALLLTSLAACASAPINGSADEIQPTGRSSDVIGYPEMASSGAHDALQAITRLRPFFLNRGREMSPSKPNVSLLQVFLDDIKLGGLETLQGIPIESIKSIKYLTSSEATLRWGTNHTGGVILLSTK